MTRYAVLALCLAACLALAGCQKERTPAPPVRKPVLPEETGPDTVCRVDTDCWCRRFTGAEFVPGKVASRCENGHCAACLYE